MANRTRTKQVCIRLTEEEYEELKKKCDESGLGFRELLLTASERATVVSRSAVSELVKQLRAVGNNINQIARAVNASGNIKEGKMQKLENELDSLQELRKIIIDTVRGE